MDIGPSMLVLILCIEVWPLNNSVDQERRLMVYSDSDPYHRPSSKRGSVVKTSALYPESETFLPRLCGAGVDGTFHKDTLVQLLVQPH